MRRLLGLSLALALGVVASSVRAGDPPAKSNDLPEGAIARLGSATHVREVRSDGVWQPATCSSIVFTSDGERIFGRSGGHAEVFDASTGRSLVSIPEDHDGRFGFGGGHRSIPNTAAISPDGKWIATTYKNDIRLHDAETGKLLRTIDHGEGRAFDVTFSPDGKLLTSVCEQQHMAISSVATGKLLKDIKGDRSSTLVFSPDGKTIASSDGSRIVLLSLEGETQRELEDTSRGETLAFAPDGKTVVGGQKDTACVWDMETGKVVRTLEGAEAPVSAVAVSPDGTIATGSDDRKIRLYDSTGELKVMLIGATSKVCGLAFSPDGRTLASAGADGIRLWKFPLRRRLESLDEKTASRGVIALALSPSGRFLAISRADAAFSVWELGPPKLLSKYWVQEPVRSLAFSADGQFLARGFLQAWSLSFGEWPRGRYLWGTRHPTQSPVAAVAFSTKKNIFIMGSGDGTITLRDLTGATHESNLDKTLFPAIQAHQGSVLSLAVSSDGTRLVSGGADKQASVWNAETGELVRKLEGHTGAVTAVAFAADGRVVTGSADKTVRVWSADGVAAAKTFSLPKEVTSVVVTPDGKRVAVACGDERIRVFDLAGEAEHSRVLAADGPVRVLALTADGKTLFSGQDDGTVLLWGFAPRFF